jgi:hypothetical protein
LLSSIGSWQNSLILKSNTTELAVDRDSQYCRPSGLVQVGMRRIGY